MKYERDEPAIEVAMSSDEWRGGETLTRFSGLSMRCRQGMLVPRGLETGMEVANERSPLFLARLFGYLRKGRVADAHQVLDEEAAVKDEVARAVRAATFLELISSAQRDRSKVIGDNDLLAVVLFPELRLLEDPVALLRRFNPPGRATGFLVRDDILITNAHVFASVDEATGAVATFNFERDEAGRLKPVFDFELRPQEFFHCNPDLDYCLVKVAGFPGRQWGTIDLTNTAEVQVDDRVIIIQHPGGLEKRVTQDDNEVKFVSKQFIQYITDTRPGSSGAPIFDEQFRLVGVHHKGGLLQLPGSENTTTYFRNQGIRIQAILTDPMFPLI